MSDAEIANNESLALINFEIEKVEAEKRRATLRNGHAASEIYSRKESIS